MEGKFEESLFVALSFALAGWALAGSLLSDLSEKGIVDDATVQAARERGKKVADLLAMKLGRETARFIDEMISGDKKWA